MALRETSSHFISLWTHHPRIYSNGVRLDTIHKYFKKLNDLLQLQDILNKINLTDHVFINSLSHHLEGWEISYFPEKATNSTLLKNSPSFSKFIFQEYNKNAVPIKCLWIEGWPFPLQEANYMSLKMQMWRVFSISNVVESARCYLYCNCIFPNG